MLAWPTHCSFTLRLASETRNDRRRSRIDCVSSSMRALRSRRAERHSFEWKRNGALSLFAALNTGTREVLGKTAPARTASPN